MFETIIREKRQVVKKAGHDWDSRRGKGSCSGKEHI